MWKRILSMALVCALYFCFVCVKPGLAQSPAEKPVATAGETPDQAQPGQTNNQPATPQTAKEAQQAARIKRDIENHGIASKITIILKDNKERYGEIASIDNDTFQVVEVDLKQLVTFAYKDVKKVRFNYGGPNPFTGKRWHPRWGLIGGIAVFAFILIVIPLSIPRT